MTLIEPDLTTILSFLVKKKNIVLDKQSSDVIISFTKNFLLNLQKKTKGPPKDNPCIRNLMAIKLESDWPIHGSHLDEISQMVAIEYILNQTLDVSSREAKRGISKTIFMRHVLDGIRKDKMLRCLLLGNLMF